LRHDRRACLLLSCKRNRIAEIASRVEANPFSKEDQMMQIGTSISIFLGLSGIFVMLFLLFGAVVVIILLKAYKLLEKNRADEH
jgi:hypothetical protein